MDKIIKEMTDEISNLRRLIYFLENTLFKQLYKECTTIDRMQVDNYIYLRDLHAVKRWIDEERCRNLETMSLGVLRETARGAGVYGWHRLNKNQLIAGVVNKRGKDENSGRSASSGPEVGKNKEGNPQTTGGGKP